MNLRRKLLTTFGALVLLGLVVAGVSVWATVSWQTSNEDLREHYTRSLQVQRIRAATFEAFREVPDALGDNDPNARQEFEDAIGPIDEDFELWASLADTDEERRQVANVREAYGVMLDDAQRFYDLLEDGDREEAAQLADGKIEESDFDAFAQATEGAVASDRALRDDVRARAEETRRNAQIVLILASLGSVSLLLLLAAYLAADLFRPLEELKDALRDVERGDLDRRLEEGRADELGAVARAFNAMAQAMGRRERADELSPIAEDGANGAAWRNSPSRVTLHRLVGQLRARIARLDPTSASPEEVREVTSQLDLLSQAVDRITGFGFPLDLSLSRTDIRALLYEVLAGFTSEVVERNVSVEVEVSSEVDFAVVDRLKLREVVSELVRNALAALPERGGKLGLRARTGEGGEALLVEVADDGSGTEQSVIDDVLEASSDDEPHVGLNMSRAIVEQHGGRLVVDTEPGEGTYVRIQLPLRT